MALSSDTDWLIKYKWLEEYYEMAYRRINNAITLQEQERYQQAVEMYEEGLRFIDKALQINIECPNEINATFEKACSMMQKMKTTRKDILEHISYCQMRVHASESKVESPPSYEEATSTASSSRSDDSYYSGFEDMVNSLKSNVGANSIRVIYTCEQVRAYNVLSNRIVTPTLQPDVLRILKLEGELESTLNHYLQIGLILHPLIPSASNCVRLEYDAILLPSIGANDLEEAIGLIIPTEKKEEVVTLLESILNPNLSDAAANSEGSSKIGRSIIAGATALSGFLITGAQKADTLLTDNTPKLINKLTPSESETKVPPNFEKGMEIAKNVTEKTAGVTEYIANAVGSATVGIGKFLAPRIRKGGTTLLKSTAGLTEENATAKVSNVMDVVGSTVSGIGTIYGGIGQSALILGRSLKSNTVQVMKHKYGEPVGKVTEKTFDTVGNGVAITQNVQILKPKKMAQRTAMSAFSKELSQTSLNANCNLVSGEVTLNLGDNDKGKNTNKNKNEQSDENK